MLPPWHVAASGHVFIWVKNQKNIFNYQKVEVPEWVETLGQTSSHSGACPQDFVMCLCVMQTWVTPAGQGHSPAQTQMFGCSWQQQFLLFLSLDKWTWNSTSVLLSECYLLELKKDVSDLLWKYLFFSFVD